MLAGLVAVVVALGCGVGFVAAVVWADDRAYEADPGAVSGFAGAPRAWAVGAAVAALLAVVLLVDAVVTGR